MTTSTHHYAQSLQPAAPAVTIREFAMETIRQFKDSGRLRTSETYRTMLNSVTAFCRGADMPLRRIDSEFVKAYEHHLSLSGLTPNTTSFYMRKLRALLNRAAEAGLIPHPDFFRGVYTGVASTVKRSLGIGAIRRLSALELSPGSYEDLARDMFMMSFYLRGMSFVDMAFLLKNDLRDGILSYRRRKTGRLLSIGWTAEMQAIVRKYDSPATPFLLPIFAGAESATRYSYLHRSYRINLHLKKLGERIGLDRPLTMYCARHTWASAARNIGIPLSIISECMGHTSERTTRIYLDALDERIIDSANSLVIHSVRSSGNKCKKISLIKKRCLQTAQY